MPRSEGAGTSTTDNVYCKTFSNQELLSEVLGIDKKLTIRFSNILITINFNNSIDPTKFANYCNETYKFFLDSYGNR